MAAWRELRCQWPAGTGSHCRTGVACSQSNTIGFTGDSAMPSIRSGAIVARNAHRSSAAQASLSASRSEQVPAFW